jgi:hypothetical protein
VNRQRRASAIIGKDVEEIFGDAENLYREAMSELRRGKIRDAAEKAWGATVRAADALILARIKEKPVRTDLTTRRLHELALKDPEIDEKLVGRYHIRQDFLHGTCFYMGVCEPLESVTRRIKETADFIKKARELAEK